MVMMPRAKRSIVEQRGQSVVAPQALFFLNDPAVSTWARSLAARVAHAAGAGSDARIRHLYLLAFGRVPSQKEIDLGLQLLAPSDGVGAWERYCLLILCTNEFAFLD